MLQPQLCFSFSSTRYFISFRQQKLRCAYEPEGSPSVAFHYERMWNTIILQAHPKKTSATSQVAGPQDPKVSQSGQSGLVATPWSCRGDMDQKSWLVDKDPYSGL